MVRLSSLAKFVFMIWEVVIIISFDYVLFLTDLLIRVYCELIVAIRMLIMSVEMHQLHPTCFLIDNPNLETQGLKKAQNSPLVIMTQWWHSCVFKS